MISNKNLFTNVVESLVVVSCVVAFIYSFVL